MLCYFHDHECVCKREKKDCDLYPKEEPVIVTESKEEPETKKIKKYRST